MAEPVIAPITPPINAPEPVLFCVPSGFWHPVNPTTEVTKTKFKVKTCSFIIQKSISLDNQRHSHIQKSICRGRLLRPFPRPLLFPKTVSAANRFQRTKKMFGAGMPRSKCQ
jgi:hypothetical protein